MKALIRRSIRASIPGLPIQVALILFVLIAMPQLLPSHYSVIYLFSFGNSPRE